MFSVIYHLGLGYRVDPTFFPSAEASPRRAWQKQATEHQKEGPLTLGSPCYTEPRKGPLC